MGGLDSKSQVLLYTIVSMIGLFMIYRFYDLGVSPALV